MQYRFAGFVLDADSLELRHGDRPIQLRRKVFDVLRLVVEAAPSAVGKEALLAAAWPGVTTSDESLTQAISQARRSLADAAPSVELIRTVRGFGYVMAVPVEAGETVEVEPPPTVAETERRRPPPPNRSAPFLRWAIWTIAGLLALLLAAGYVLSRDPGLPPPAAALPDLAAAPIGVSPEDSVAVLPFDDLSPNGGHAYLGDGLAEELTDELARIEGLRVAARTSAWRFRGGTADVQTIGQRLGVAKVVEGSVRLDEDRLRVTVQLVRASDGFHTYSDTFDRDLGGLLDLQDELAATLAAQLERELVRSRRRAEAVSVEAKLLFLRAAANIRMPREESLRMAISQLERAVEIEPEYAAAWSLLASAHSLLWTAVLRAAPRTSEHLVAAEYATDRAMELAPDEAFSLRALGRIRLYRYRDWAGARAAMKRAVEIRPDVAGLVNYAVLLAKGGRLEEATELVLRALAEEPLRSSSIRTLGRLYLYQGEYHKSIALLHRLRELNPHDTDLPSLLSKAYGELGLEAASREAILLWFPDSVRPAVRVFARVLGTVRTLRLLTTLSNSSSGNRCGSVAWTSAHIFALSGETDRMLECLEIAAERSLFFIVSEPTFDPYRADPRFQDLMARNGYDEATLRRAFPVDGEEALD